MENEEQGFCFLPSRALKLRVFRKCDSELARAQAGLQLVGAELWWEGTVFIDRLEMFAQLMQQQFCALDDVRLAKQRLAKSQIQRQ